MQHASNAIPQDKQSGPLFLLLLPGGNTKVFDTAAEADHEAAQQFSAAGGKAPVYVFALAKVALPALPKVEFTEAKRSA